MLSAPASIPPITQAAFATGFGDSTLSRCSRRSCRPAASANSHAGTSPPVETRFGSSKTGRIFVKGFHPRGVPCSSFEPVSGNSDSPAQQGIPRSTPRSTTHDHRWIRAYSPRVERAWGDPDTRPDARPQTAGQRQLAAACCLARELPARHSQHQGLRGVRRLPAGPLTIFAVESLVERTTAQSSTTETPRRIGSTW